jgi:hypothetical protein
MAGRPQFQCSQLQQIGGGGSAPAQPAEAPSASSFRTELGRRYCRLPRATARRYCLAFCTTSLWARISWYLRQVSRMTRGICLFGREGGK